jgi:hypothetical protein
MVLLLEVPAWWTVQDQSTTVSVVVEHADPGPANVLTYPVVPLVEQADHLERGLIIALLLP